MGNEKLGNVAGKRPRAGGLNPPEKPCYVAHEKNVMCRVMFVGNDAPYRAEKDTWPSVGGHPTTPGACRNGYEKMRDVLCPAVGAVSPTPRTSAKFTGRLLVIAR